MLGLKLNHVSKSSHWKLGDSPCHDAVVTLLICSDVFTAKYISEPSWGNCMWTWSCVYVFPLPLSKLHVKLMLTKIWLVLTCRSMELLFKTKKNWLQICVCGFCEGFNALSGDNVCPALVQLNNTGRFVLVTQETIQFRISADSSFYMVVFH